MTIKELRAYLKEKGIKGYSTMKKAELEVKVQKIQQEDRRVEYDRQLRENALCHACLTEQRKQRKIDDKTHNERLFELTVRDLVCEYCKHVNLAQDKDHTVCADCGTLQKSDAEVGY